MGQSLMVAQHEGVERPRLCPTFMETPEGLPVFGLSYVPTENRLPLLRDML